MRDDNSSWAEKPLGELLDIARETIVPNAYGGEQFVHYSIPAWDERHGPTVEKGAAIGSAKFWIKHPTILVSKLNPRISRVVLVDHPNGHRHCASTEFIPYVAKADGVSLSFYKWFFQSRTFQHRLERIATGSTNSHTRAHGTETLEWSVPSPSPTEQFCITAMLDTVDDAIAKTETMIAKLKQVRAGVVHDLLTRGLDENGQLRDPVAHPEQFQDLPLGQIPNEWEVRPLESCVSSEITYGIVQAGPHVEGGVPYIRTGDMAGNRLVVDQMLRTSPEIAARYRRSRVQADEIVCAIRATVGKVLPVPPELDGANLTQGTARIAPKDEIDPTFLLWAIRSDKTQRQIALEVKGTTFFEITLANLRRIKVTIPSQRKEQEQIAAVIQGLETRLSSEANGLSKLQDLKSGLMADLLIGRVRVPASLGLMGPCA